MFKGESLYYQMSITLAAHEMRNEIQFITGDLGFSWLSQSRIAEERPNS
jgi:hypothetical protein